MADALDMSLDDLIKKNKQSHQPQHQQQKQHRPSPSAASRGGRGAPAFSGPARRFPNRAAARATPYKAPGYGAQPIPAVAAAAGGGGAGIETGTKLYISNLDYGVSNEDIKELFSEVGDLKRYSINYDRSGRSKGTAEVVFARRSDALSAVKRYNNVQLDGKPMKIEVIGTNIEVPVPVPAPVPFAFNGAFTNFNGPPKSGPGRGGGGGWPRGGGVFGVRGRGRGGRGRGRGGRGNQQVSAADLDADLDKYHAEAMQIN